MPARPRPMSIAVYRSDELTPLKKTSRRVSIGHGAIASTSKPGRLDQIPDMNMLGLHISRQIQPPHHEHEHQSAPKLRSHQIQGRSRAMLHLTRTYCYKRRMDHCSMPISGCSHAHRLSLRGCSLALRVLLVRQLRVHNYPVRRSW